VQVVVQTLPRINQGVKSATIQKLGQNKVFALARELEKRLGNYSKEDVYTGIP
jgi:hypothetical protein